MGSALGFTIKSGWTCAVVLGGSAESPEVVETRTIELSDPANAKARQPYHAATGTAQKPGPHLDRLIASVERFGRQSVREFLREQASAGRVFEGAGIVVGSLIDPAQIANDHIRIHALEGQLFRGIVKDATERRHLASLVWRERDLYGLAVARFKRAEGDVRQQLTAFGRHLSGPWRAEQKAAALAAWLVMANAKRSKQAVRTVFK